MRENIRRVIDDTILYLYRDFRVAVFPIDPAAVIQRVQHCGYITYDRLALVSGASYADVVKACRSRDGSTQYDPASGRYLIAINTSRRYGASRARIRWTTAHELGHVSAGHFIEMVGGNPVGTEILREMEEEADYFAASLLAPIPALKRLHVRRPADIHEWFGLSQTAAEYRWADYQRGDFDPRLEEHFRFFCPISEQRERRRRNPKNLDIFMDSDSQTNSITESTTRSKSSIAYSRVQQASSILE